MRNRPDNLTQRAQQRTLVSGDVIAARGRTDVHVPGSHRRGQRHLEQRILPDNPIGLQLRVEIERLQRRLRVTRRKLHRRRVNPRLETDIRRFPQQLAVPLVQRIRRFVRIHLHVGMLQQHLPLEPDPPAPLPGLTVGDAPQERVQRAAHGAKDGLSVGQGNAAHQMNAAASSCHSSTGADALSSGYVSQNTASLSRCPEVGILGVRSGTVRCWFSPSTVIKRRSASSCSMAGILGVGVQPGVPVGGVAHDLFR